jgi:hypothetical protein
MSPASLNVLKRNGCTGKFKCPLKKKTQPSCPGSRDLNWTGKGLTLFIFQRFYISKHQSFILNSTHDVPISHGCITKTKEIKITMINTAAITKIFKYSFRKND